MREADLTGVEYENLPFVCKQLAVGIHEDAGKVVHGLGGFFSQL